MRNLMKPARSLGLLAAVSAIVLVVAACATGPHAGSGAPVSVTVLSSRDMGSYGPTYNSNPFIAPDAFIKGSPDEFVVLDVTLALPDSATVNIDAAVTDEAGTTVARMYSLDDMRRYWSDWGDQSEKNSRTRIETLVRWYPPSSQFVAHKGGSEYIIVLIGKRPIPRPSTAAISVSINAVEQGPFTYALPPRK
jgi:hypothetical protein